MQNPESHSDPRPWDDTKRLFEAALELGEPAREQFLEGIADEHVRQEVRSLLTWHDGSDDFLEDPPIRVPELTPGDDPALELVGHTLGSWRLVGLIGQGGMGVVYRAERADAAFTRQAAVKVIGAGADAARVLEWFRLERETLAGLHHRNIAELYDGGTTPDGRPYFVMELVDGVPIDRYCDDRRLSIDERLELFCRICNGVQHAHENLVLHRDIKPDNILVTADGTPKLLDFGVSRIISREVDPSAGPEAAATRPMTPDFASPEHMLGRAATTSADVYSLGVVLYILLTGRRPYRLSKASPSQIQAQLASAVVVPPSVAVHSGDEVVLRASRRSASSLALRAQVSGDLDAVVMRALERTPHSRYSTVQQLLQDVRAFQGGRPVAARAPTTGYLVSKFVRRHWRLLVVAGVVAALAAISVGAIVWQASVATTERARAERRFNDVRQLVNTFLFDVGDVVANVSGTLPARELIVRTTLSYLDGLAREAPGDIGLQRELARAWVRIGDVQGNPSGANMGDTAGAKTSYERAVALADAVRQAAPADVEIRRTLALAHRRMGDVLAMSGDATGALLEHRVSKGLYADLASAESPSRDDRVEAAIAAVKVGDVLGNPNLPNLGRAADAATQFDEALVAFRQLDRLFPNDARIQRYIGLSLERIGTLHEDAKRWNDAELAYRESFEIRQALAGREPMHHDIQRDYAVAFEKLGKVERDTGRPGAGTANLRQALSQFQRLAAADPTDANAAHTVAISQEILASAFRRAGQPSDARELLETALASHRGLAAGDASNAQAKCDAVRVSELLGDVFADIRPPAPADACQQWRASAATLQALRAAGDDACQPEPALDGGLVRKLRACR